jgi:Polyketide cyclase / dehydrase and lipid transport
MKIKYEAEIKASREFVWAAFDDPHNLSRWQPTLESFTHRAGEPGQPGAVSELVYNENGKKITTTETVTERREPIFRAGYYDSACATTLIVNHFDEVDDNTTRLVSYTNINFKGIMKIMSLFAARSIRTRIEANMNRFKLLVETEAAGAEL